MKARAQSLLTGKLGSLVRSKPPLPPTASAARPPVSPGTHGNKTPRSPQHVPRSPTAPLGGEGRRGPVPVIKPHLVKKGEEKTNPQCMYMYDGCGGLTNMRGLKLYLFSSPSSHILFISPPLISLPLPFPHIHIYTLCPSLLLSLPLPSSPLSPPISPSPLSFPTGSYNG